MSLEHLTFTPNDPLQANVVVKPYDCLALFAPIAVLPTDPAYLAFVELVAYYKKNGILTTFYLADVNDGSVSLALSTAQITAPTNQAVMAWIREGGRLESTTIVFTKAPTTADFDAILRTNLRHDPSIDTVLPFPSDPSQQTVAAPDHQNEPVFIRDDSVQQQMMAQMNLPPTPFSVSSQTTVTQMPTAANGAKKHHKMPWHLILTIAVVGVLIARN